jgi:hypothetical protein
MDAERKAARGRIPGPATSTLGRRHSGPNSILTKDKSMPSYDPAARSYPAFPVNRGIPMPPVIGRSMWCVVVLRCLLCNGGHTHRSGDGSMVLSGNLIRRCPVTGRRYRLRVTQRRSEARRVVQLQSAVAA